jgi:hypothetical protein
MSAPYDVLVLEIKVVDLLT